jgi:ABC-type bacteriocin/lantibiotic exporter with double-glycine peptidase domain
MNNTLHRGPFPLHITKNDDHFVIVTNHKTHYAKTFDPSAAHLIAAAPDLLSALIELERVESSPHSETVRYLARENAREAIRKAKGEA